MYERLIMCKIKVPCCFIYKEAPMYAVPCKDAERYDYGLMDEREHKTMVEIVLSFHRACADRKGVGNTTISEINNRFQHEVETMDPSTIGVTKDMMNGYPVPSVLMNVDGGMIHAPNPS